MSCHLEANDTDSSTGAQADARPPIKRLLRQGGGVHTRLVWVLSHTRGQQPSLPFPLCYVFDMFIFVRVEQSSQTQKDEKHRQKSKVESCSAHARV